MQKILYTQGLRKELHDFRTFLLRPSKSETGKWVLAPICSVFNIAKVVKERLSMTHNNMDLHKCCDFYVLTNLGFLDACNKGK